MSLPALPTSYRVVKRCDGYRVMVARGDLEVPVTEIVEKVEALRIAQRLSDRQQDLLQAFREALK